MSQNGGRKRPNQLNLRSVRQNWGVPAPYDESLDGLDEVPNIHHEFNRSKQGAALSEWARVQRNRMFRG